MIDILPAYTKEKNKRKRECRVYGAVTYLYLLPVHIHFSIVGLLISKLNGSACRTEVDTSQTQIAANAATNCRFSIECI